MKLRTYIEQNGLTVRSFADQAGISQELVYKLLNGERKGSFETMARIREATGGAVQPNDFFEAAPGAAA